MTHGACSHGLLSCRNLFEQIAPQICRHQLESHVVRTHRGARAMHGAAMAGTRAQLPVPHNKAPPSHTDTRQRCLPLPCCQVPPGTSEHRLIKSSAGLQPCQEHPITQAGERQAWIWPVNRGSKSDKLSASTTISWIVKDKEPDSELICHRCKYSVSNLAAPRHQEQL